MLNAPWGGPSVHQSLNCRVAPPPTVFEANTSPILRSFALRSLGVHGPKSAISSCNHPGVNVPSCVNAPSFTRHPGVNAPSWGVTTLATPASSGGECQARPALRAMGKPSNCPARSQRLRRRIKPRQRRRFCTFTTQVGAGAGTGTGDAAAGRVGRGQSPPADRARHELKTALASGTRRLERSRESASAHAERAEPPEENREPAGSGETVVKRRHHTLLYCGLESHPACDCAQPARFQSFHSHTPLVVCLLRRRSTKYKDGTLRPGRARAVAKNCPQPALPFRLLHGHLRILNASSSFQRLPPLSVLSIKADQL